MPSCIPHWEEFFRRYSWDAILELAKEYPDRRSLYIDFSDICAFDLELGRELIEHPDGVLKHAEAALAGLDLPADVEDWGPHTRIKNVPDKIRRRDLRDEHIHKLVCLDGLVLRITDVSPKIVNAAFTCRKCGNVMIIPQTEGFFSEPFECDSEVCGRKGAFRLSIESSETVNFQKMRLQEAPEDLNGGEKSQSIDLNLRDDLVGVLLPGQRVTITGILRTYQKNTKEGKSSNLGFDIDVLSYRVSDGRETVEITPEDKVRLFALSKQPGVTEKLVDSFAPTIHGLRAEKEGMLVSCVSNGYKIRPDGTIQRDFSHFLWCSDPGLAKTELKHALKKIRPDLILASGTGSTKAGLTAAAVKDDFAGGAWSIEAGALPLADMGGLVIDEFDKFSKDDVRSLNDALSNCQFEKSAAGLHVKLWARCFVVALLNPKHGRFDTYEPLGTQINLPPDTLSRFDLIFVGVDTVEESHDRLVARRMLNTWAENEPEHQEEIIPIEDMQKYIALARSIQPKYSPDVLDAIENRFILTRKKSDNGRVAVTNRHVEALLRLSKGEAQLALSETVTLEHFNRAVSLLEASLYQIGVDEKGQLDTDIVNSGCSKSQRDKIRLIRDIITKQYDNGMAAMLDVFEEAEKECFSKKELESLIENMKQQGEIYNPKPGFLRVVT